MPRVVPGFRSRDVMRSLEALKNPPIVEVGCGIIFDPIENLDPVSIGSYWHSRRADFPDRQVMHAVGDATRIVVGPGVGPLRTWLISPTGNLVLQIQSDRFYLNWRRRAD